MCRRHVWECSVNSVQSLSRDWFIAAPWTTGRQTFLPITNLKSFLKLVYIESLMLHPLLSPSSPAFNLSQHQGLFQRVSSSHQVAKVLELQHQSFQWILISFKIDFDLLAVQGMLKSLLQHHSSKASDLERSALFMVQLSHLYMTTGKTIFMNKCIHLCIHIYYE